MIRTIMILLASVLLLASPVRADGIADLSGEWIGTWTSLHSPTYNGVIEMKVEQNGNNVSGTSLVGNTKCSPERVFQGTLSGLRNNVIELELASGESPAESFAKNVGVITKDRNAISAVYSFNSNSACDGDVGTMFISKVQPYSKIQGIQ